jgi:hypothetical protein
MCVELKQMAFTVDAERNADLLSTIEAVKKNLVEVNQWLNNLKSAMENGEWKEARLGSGRCRMRLSESIQKIDRLSVNISNSERVESIGYQPKTLGGRDYAKSDSGDNLIQNILRGNISARKALEGLKPKEARNQ